LLAVLAVAGILRIYWAVTHAGAIENEGAEYCRLAENLLGGRGYVGVITNSGQLNFPPLYPLLIAGLSLVVRKSELAGRVISLVAGIGLVWGVYLVCRHVYGRRVALIGALTVALHPVFIALSMSVYSEGPYLALTVFGLYWVLRAAADRRIVSGVIAGLLLGLAYLVRPEALVLASALLLPAVALGFLWQEPRRAVATAGAMLVTVLVVAAPYIYFLWARTGQVRWEGKGGIAYAIGQRMNRGMSYLEASYGIDANLREEGIHLKGRDVLQSGAVPAIGADGPSSVARYFLGSARRNLGRLLRVVADNRAFGSPLLFVLMLIGLFRTTWSKERISGEAVLVTAFGTSLVILLVGQTHDFRHTLALLALMAIWGAKGVDELVEWATGTISSVFSGGLYEVSVALRCLIVLALCGMAFQTINAVGEFSQSSDVHLKEAGLWLKAYAPGAKSIMGTGTTVPYYAGGDLQYLPYAGSDLALRYIEQKAPDFVVLESVKLRPYIDSWLKDGIPSRKARLIYSGGAGEGEVVIYEWRHS
jgi:4-amino-4-deoxy-L-arabinose transferase-like glycosyltransferase